MGDSIFAGYLNHLAEHGDIRDRELFDDMWAAMRRILSRELSRRELWRLPPTYLGICGFSTWTDEALDDLAQDCYLFSVHERRRSLLAKWRAGHDIDGLVIRNTRNFLFETQKKNDPLGFRIFELLRIAARETLKEGVLEILAGDPRVRNNTVLELAVSPDRRRSTEEDLASGEGFSPDERLPEERLPEDRAKALFDDVAGPWCDRLLPEMVTVRGAGVRDCVDELKALLVKLPSRGIVRFRFGDLVEAIKKEARHRWIALGSRELPRENVPEVPAGHELEQREQYRVLVGRLRAAVDALPGRRATRDYLNRLLDFLCLHAREAERPERLPSSRRLAERLNIPRHRMTELLATLRTLADSASEGLEAAAPPWMNDDGKATETPVPRPHRPLRPSRTRPAGVRPREFTLRSTSSRDRFSSPLIGSLYDGRASP